MIFTKILLNIMSINSGLTYCKFEGKVITRFAVPKDKQSWTQHWPQYHPTSFTLDFKGKDWADPHIGEVNFNPKWNQIDGKVDRRSHHSLEYSIDDNGFPLNPEGRTGIRLRGLLGRWGPNHAADPIVTRWKRNEKMEVVKDESTHLPILQFVAIQRRDTKEWAIPGGMIDIGEEVTKTLKREFFEEAFNGLEMQIEKRKQLEIALNDFFSNGHQIYRGCVDDPRNTDNAWMETVATNFHDQNGDIIGNMELNAGDDALRVKWMDINRDLKLYANHCEFIKLTANRLSAHF